MCVKMESIIWYKQLDPHQKILLKSYVAKAACGIPWEGMIKILGFRQTLHSIYMKLIKIGIDVSVEDKSEIKKSI